MHHTEKQWEKVHSWRAALLVKEGLSKLGKDCIFPTSERFCAIRHVKYCCNRFSPRSKTILTIPGACRGAKEAQGEEIEVQRLVSDRIDRLK
jgi:hypothetical protein